MNFSIFDEFFYFSRLCFLTNFQVSANFSIVDVFSIFDVFLYFWRIFLFFTNLFFIFCNSNWFRENVLKRKENWPIWPFPEVKIKNSIGFVFSISGTPPSPSTKNQELDTCRNPRFSPYTSEFWTYFPICAIGPLLSGFVDRFLKMFPKWILLK